MIHVLLSLALTAAAPATQDSADRPIKAQPAKPKKVCEKLEVTGSSVPKRVCRIVKEAVPQAEAANEGAAAKATAGATN